MLKLETVSINIPKEILEWLKVKEKKKPQWLMNNGKE